MYISKTTLLIVCGLMVAFILLTCHYSSAPMHGSSEIADTSEWVNNAGDVVESLKADPAYFEKAKQEVIDSMARTFKTTAKKVIEYITIHEHGESDIPQNGTTAADYLPVDSGKKDCPPEVKSLSADFSNPYYDAKVKVYASGDSSAMHISSRDTLTLLWKWVPEGNIFHRTKKLQLDVSNANPDNKIYIDHAYRITEKPKRWAIGFSAGYGVPLTGNILKPVPMISFGVTKTLIRF
jgi:hypothetical protein